LAKERPSRLLASSVTVANASEKESARWSVGETVSLRGLDQPTQIAVPA
jgi:adenylate cyclase